MKTQRIKLPDGRLSWLVLDDNYQPVEPITRYVRYLETLERSPNTILNYASHLRFFWEFLRDSHLDWTQVTLETLADFITWLRRPEPRAISLQLQEAKRTERTINVILSAVYGFYEFHHRLGNVADLKGYAYQIQRNRKFKPFLHHITKGKPTQVRLLKLREPKRKIKIHTVEEVQQILEACTHIRDKFLICLLYETGIRIGQALGLRHEDIRSLENEIVIVPRSDNANGVRAKRKDELTIDVSKELIELYSEYLIQEYPEDVDSDYVFINIWDGKIGHPMHPRVVGSLFERLSEKTGIETHPHKFRHTHATDLIKNGWDMAFVQKRLGHASVQTTINTYTHLDNKDLKEAYQKYLQQKGKQ